VSSKRATCTVAFLESSRILVGMTTTLDPSFAKLVEVRAAVRSGKARQLRESAGISQAEVAAAIGVTPAAVSRWEAGARKPTGLAAQRYAQLLDLLARGD
jgi:DNA-binding transcriptional regulator YiaG